MYNLTHLSVVKYIYTLKIDKHVIINTFMIIYPIYIYVIST